MSLRIACKRILVVKDSSISFTFGDSILAKVQATLGGDAKKEMYKGISFAYPILLSSYVGCRCFWWANCSLPVLLGFALQKL